VIGGYTRRMDAEPLLAEVARQLRAVRLDAVLIGNAAAALQGAPVTTVDFDFLFRKTPRNMEKMKAVAKAVGATIHGVRSFAGLRDRATTIDIGGVPVLVASLDDVIKSKRAAKRPRDLALARHPGGRPWRQRSQAERPGWPHSPEKLNASTASSSSGGSVCRRSGGRSFSENAWDLAGRPSNHS